MTLSADLAAASVSAKNLEDALATAQSDLQAARAASVTDQATIAALKATIVDLQAKLAAATGSTPPPTPTPTPIPPVPTDVCKFGAYLGHGSGQLVQTADWFKSSTGVYPKCLMTYSGNPNSWFIVDADLVAVAPWLKADATRLLVLSVQPNAAVAAWDDPTWDYKHTALANRLVNLGITSQTVIRIGWEMNAYFGAGWGWQGISKSLADMTAAQDGYKRLFNRIAPLYRAKGLRTNWCTNYWNQNNSAYPYDSRKWYPGPANVDIHGIDYYDLWLGVPVGATPDQRWAATQPFLDAAKAFATLNGKPFAVDEWGCAAAGGDGNGGGDNPTFITNSMKWQKANCIYSMYFESKDGGIGVDLTVLPLSRAAYAAAAA